MQDRFKFRIWNETKKYWEERAHISILYSCTELRIYKDTKEGWAQDAKQAGYKLVLEQCTGVKDKNGKLIYEGDIVKRGSSIAEVYWDAPCYTIRKKDGRICWLWGNLSEVIGNIHENPELLEAKNDN